MKRTSLYGEHEKLGAKFVDFGGWEMPVMYSSVVEEHTATRSSCGLFDVSHMGEIILRGRDSSRFLRRMIPTSLDKLVTGKSMYSVLCNENGGVIDDLFIYKKGNDEFFIVVNAGTKDKDLQWMMSNRMKDMDIIDHTDQLSKIDIQGPLSRDIARKVFGDQGYLSLKRFYYCDIRYGDKNIMISQTGYTGELGYEIYLENDDAPGLWNDLLLAGEPLGLKPAGLGARDTLRLEACYSLYGHELNDDISPLEAGLGWLLSSNDEYIGKPAIRREKSEGAKRSNIVFQMTDRGIPREGYGVSSKGSHIGIVTSGTFSPTLQRGIGMALVTTGAVSLEDDIEIQIRNKQYSAKVSKRPLYVYHG